MPEVNGPKRDSRIEKLQDLKAEVETYELGTVLHISSILKDYFKKATFLPPGESPFVRMS